MRPDKERARRSPRRTSPGVCPHRIASHASRLPAGVGPCTRQRGWRACRAPTATSGPVTPSHGASSPDLRRAPVLQAKGSSRASDPSGATTSASTLSSPRLTARMRIARPPEDEPSSGRAPAQRSAARHGSARISSETASEPGSAASVGRAGVVRAYSETRALGRSVSFLPGVTATQTRSGPASGPVQSTDSSRSASSLPSAMVTTP